MPLPPAAEEIAHLVDKDNPQPGAEGAGPAVVDEGGQLLADDDEDVLEQVLDVGGLELVPAQPGPQPRLVHRQPALPRLGVLSGLEPVEQTLGCGLHATIPEGRCRALP
jgi:hypothetical protein